MPEAPVTPPTGLVQEAIDPGALEMSSASHFNLQVQVQVQRLD